MLLPHLSTVLQASAALKLGVLASVVQPITCRRTASSSTGIADHCSSYVLAISGGRNGYSVLSSLWFRSSTNGFHGPLEHQARPSVRM